MLLIVVCMFGGLFGGLFTATEAGAVGALLAIGIGFARRSLSVRGLGLSLVETLIASGTLLLIAVGANLFTRLVALSGLSREVGQFVETLGLGPTALLLVIVLIYLALGMVLEPMGALLLTLPLFLPLVQAQGIGTVWFGLLVAKLLETGMITPPVGLNTFVIHSVARDYLRLEQVFAGVMSFIAADLALVAAMLLSRGLF